MSSAQEEQGGKAPAFRRDIRYTVFELEDEEAYGLENEFEARGIYASAISPGIVSVNSDQHGQAMDLLGEAGYGHRTVKTGMTPEEVLTWFSRELGEDFEKVLEPASD